MARGFQLVRILIPLIFSLCQLWVTTKPVLALSNEFNGAPGIISQSSPLAHESASSRDYNRSAASWKEASVRQTSTESLLVPETDESVSADEEAAAEETTEANEDEQESDNGESAQSLAAASATTVGATAGPDPPEGSSTVSLPIPQNEKFSGSASVGIPIVAPPGRAGLAPSLALRYSSSPRNGWVGVGWDLDMGAIQRATKNGVSFTGKDFVVVNGGSSTELVPRPASFGETDVYEAKIEGDFFRYKYNSSTSGFEQTTREGMKYYFGSTNASRQFDPLNTTRVFKWLLDRVEDTNGNFMTISYTKDQEQVYPDQIIYNASRNNPGLGANLIKFYLEARSDARVSYAQNFKVVTAKRLKSIDVWSNGDHVRAYGLIYNTSTSQAGSSVLASVQQYGSDSRLDGNGAVLLAGTQLPAITLATRPNGNGSFRAEDVGVPWSVPGVSSGACGVLSAPKYKVLTGDFNGDGLTDIVRQWSIVKAVYYDPILQVNTAADWATSIQFLESHPDGTFEEILLLTGEAYGIPDNFTDCSQAQPPLDGITLGDFNGDGFTDFVFYFADYHMRYNNIPILTKSGVYASNGNGGFSLQSSNPGLPAPKEYRGQKFWQPGDFNRDGKTDILAWDGVTLTAYLSNGAGAFVKGGTIANVTSQNFQVALGDYNGDGATDVLYRYGNGGWSAYMAKSDGSGTFTPLSNVLSSGLEGLMPSDVNGDGLTDVIGWTSGGWYLYFAKGDGTFATEDRRFFASYDKAISALGDFNGDGLKDALVTHNGDSYGYVYYSKGDGAFKVATSSLGTSGITVGDVNGDGMDDVINGCNSFGTPASQVLIALDVVPDLLETVANGVGGTTGISYAPSSLYSNKLLPFVVQTVASITVNDDNGNVATTSFGYEGGYFDFATREFRGFEYVKQVNPDGSENATCFHQGDTAAATIACSGASQADEYYFKGRPYRIISREPNGSGLGKVVNGTEELTWARVFVDPAEQTNPTHSKNASAFVKLRQKYSKTFENGGVDPVLQVQETFLYHDYLDLPGLSAATMTGCPIQSEKSNVTDPTTSEVITTKKEYKNYGVSGALVWRLTRQTLAGNLSSPNPLRDTQYDYSSGTGNLLREIHVGPENPTITFSYDVYGNRTRTTGPMGNTTTGSGVSWTTTNDLTKDTTTFTYDTATQTYPVKTTNILGFFTEQVINYQYGKPNWSKDENGNFTYYYYDALGRTSQIVYPDGGQTDFIYVVNARELSVTTKVKESSTSTIDKTVYRDGLGRNIMTTSLGTELGETVSKYVVTEQIYDIMGRASKAKGPYFAQYSGPVLVPLTASIPLTTTQHDYRGRPVKITVADGAAGIATTFTYSGLSRTITDPDGKSKTETKDYLGRLTKVVEDPFGASLTTLYTYDAAGSLLTVTDAKNNTTTIHYDALGRKDWMNDPDMCPNTTTKWTYTYFKSGNLWTQTDAKGQTITFAYDGLNRLTSKTYSTGSDSAVTYAYCTTGTCVANGKNRLASVTKAAMGSESAVAVTIDEYDKMGRVKTKTRKIDTKTYTTTSTFDLAGRPDSITYPSDNYVVTNAYHPGTGLLNTVKGSDNKPFATLTGYSPAGKIGKIIHVNNTMTNYTYDPWTMRLWSIRTQATTQTSSANLQWREYQYTNAGDVQTITDKTNTVVTYGYSYDALHRLTSESISGGQTTSYSYDATGNITSKTEGTTTSTYTYDQAHVHAVKSINGKAFTYDNNGNMTIGPDLASAGQTATRMIGYNADNMPVSVNHSLLGVTKFMYDGSGARVKKYAIDGTGTYYVDGIFEEETDTTKTKYIFAGSLRVAMVKGASSTVYAFHKDHLGSSTVVTNASGAVLETTGYTPFGTERSAVSQTDSHRFTDQEWDGETGLYNYGARLYDPVTGRFVSADTLVQKYSDPQTLNRYSYCRNNPLIYTDPSGHLFGFDDLTIAILVASMAKGAAIGAGVGGAIAAATGGDIGQGMLTGAISGACFGGVGAIAQAGGIAGGSLAAMHAGAGAVSGGINAGITGGNIGMGALIGGASAGFAEYAGGALFSDGGILAAGLEAGSWTESAAQLAGASVIGGVTGGVTEAACGGDFGHGFGMGAMTAAIGYLDNNTMHKVITTVSGEISTYNLGGQQTCLQETMNPEAMTGAARQEYMSKMTMRQGVYATFSAEGIESQTVRINDRIGVNDPPQRVLDVSPMAMSSAKGVPYTPNAAALGIVNNASVTYFHRW